MCFLDECNKIKKFFSFWNLDQNGIPDLSRNLINWLILKFIFFDCKTTESQSKCSNLIANMIYACFLDEWQKLRSFSHFQILTKIAYPYLSRSDENWLILKFLFFDCKTTKSQSKWSNSIVNMIYTCFLDEFNKIKKLWSF